MFRIIRWLCFPLARRLGVWPIAIYYALALALLAVRWGVFPPSEQALDYLPAWFFPAIYGFFLAGFPLLMLIFNRAWYRIPVRD